MSHRLHREWGLGQIDEKVIDRYGLRVRSGPFTGLVLTKEVRGEHLGPYLLGTYESELHDWLEEIRRLELLQVIDIGAKFGYYAVGLALWFPGAQSIAYDTDPWARRLLRRTARANGVSSIDVRGYLRAGELRNILRSPALILSDCEGFESELFAEVDPQQLAGCWLLIELHESFAPGIQKSLEARFLGTHVMDLRTREERVPPPFLQEFLTTREASLAVQEFRGDQKWILCRPRAPMSPVESAR